LSGTKRPVLSDEAFRRSMKGVKHQLSHHRTLADEEPVRDRLSD
jgi:hypothetical protein